MDRICRRTLVCRWKSVSTRLQRYSRNWNTFLSVMLCDSSSSPSVWLASVISRRRSSVKQQIKKQQSGHVGRHESMTASANTAHWPPVTLVRYLYKHRHTQIDLSINKLVVVFIFFAYNKIIRIEPEYLLHESRCSPWTFKHRFYQSIQRYNHQILFHKSQLNSEIIVFSPCF